MATHYSPKRLQADNAGVATATSPDGRRVKIPNLTLSQLRQELASIGENPGPINSSNRELYESLLTRKWSTLSRESQPEVTSPPPKKKARTSTKGAQMKQIKVKGVVPATFTPFSDSGNLNLPVIDLYVDHLLKSGINTVFVNGKTGEGLTMTISERKAVTEKWIQAVAGRMTVIVHVGAVCLRDAKELASHSETIGANAIATIPPVFHKPATIKSLVQCFKEISSSAPRLPLFFYNNPEATGVDFNTEEVLKAAHTKVPNLCGVKFTSFDLTDFSRCLQLHDGSYQMLYGRDEQLLGALAHGATACVGTTYNFAGKLNNRLIAAYERGDMATAQKEQYRSQAAILVYRKYADLVGPAASGKAIMQLIGLNVGPPRLPEVALSAPQVKEMQKELNEIGFFDWY